MKHILLPHILAKALWLWLIATLALVVIGLIVPAARAAGPWYVKPGGSDGNSCLSAGSPCATINGAIGKASPGDTIKVAVGTYTSTAGSEVVLIDKNLTLSGGWNSGFTTQSGMSTIDGEGARRGVVVNSGVSTVVEHFVIQNGFAYQQIGGGIYNNGGALTLNSSVVRHNTADSAGGGYGAYLNNSALILNNSAITDNTTQYDGGGIFASDGTVVILNNSTVSLNAAHYGGGIINYGTVTLNNSTVSGNTGGGIYDANTGSVTLNNSTVSGNIGAGIINGNNNGPVTLRNSILAGNTVSFFGLDCAGIISSAGYNLIGNVAGCTFTPATGDLTNIDPKLGVLLGSPAYQPLLSGSPAIDAGNPTGCTDNLGNPLPTDQRGAPRVGRCDIGAYEYTTPGPAANISPFAGTPQRTPPLMTFATPLQAVVLDSIGSPVSTSTVTFTAPSSGASGIFASSGTSTTTAVTDGGGIVTASAFTANGTTGGYTVTATVSGVITNASFLLTNLGWYVTPTGNNANDCQSPATPCATINGALGKAGFMADDTILVAAGTYTGTGTEVVLLDQDVRVLGGWNAAFTTQSGMSTIDGEEARRGITVNSGVTAIVGRFVIQNGSATWTSGNPDGGGIFNSGTLTMSNSTITGNIADFLGGGIANKLESVGVYLALNNSTVSGNSADGGGGIYSDGPLTLNNSTVSGNTSQSGGGGGIYGGNPLILNKSTVSGNSATGSGGGLSSGGDVRMNNSTISGNTAAGDGGGILDTNANSLTINNSTIANNIAGGVGGGIYYKDYAIYGIVVLRNSLVAGNSANTAPDCSGYIGSSGYSLIGNSTGCNNYSSGTGDLLNVDPQLGQLIGSPAYYPLLPGSPAINAGNPAGCTDSVGNPLPTDQRGVPRVGRCDIGAYEYTTPGPAASITAVSGTPQRTAPFSAFENPFEVLVLDSIGSPVSNTIITFSAPVSGASGTYASSGTYTTAVTTNANGFATASTFTANGSTGSYTVTATVAGVITPANFLLTNIGWYVALAGNNANDCQTATTPCATISGVLGKAGFVTGDTALVGAGTYTGSGNEVVLLNKSVRLLGGWNAAFTAQTGSTTLDGQNARRGMTANINVAATVERFVIQNGSAPTAGSGADVGGGIYNQGALTVTNSTISNNTASFVDGHAGGIYNDGILVLNNSLVSGNVSTGSGGGIYNYAFSATGIVTLHNTVVSGNSTTAGGYGGGISTNGGTVTLNNSMVSKNTANVNGGGGGGIESNGSKLILNNSTVSNNTVNQFIFGTASNGGGIYANGGFVFLNNSTISGNRAQSTGLGGGMYNLYSTVTLRNTIVAGNSASGGGPDCGGTINSAGYNLVGNTSGCTFTLTTGDLVNVDPKLGLLQDNGGPTFTHGLLPGSPAIDAGNPSGCMGSAGPLTTDQRSYSRVGQCDIGAVELQELETSVKTVDVSAASPGTPVTYTLLLRNTSGTDVNNVLITDTLPLALTYNLNSLNAPSGTFGYATGVITWTGLVNTGGIVTVTFGATLNQTAPLSTTIPNSALISGGEVFTRTAIVNIPPAKIYLPLVTRDYCSPFSDNFSNPASGWPVADDGQVRYEYLSGEYRILVRPTDTWAGARPGVKCSDYTVAVDVRNATGTAGTYGLIFGLSDDWQQFYTFEIAPDGYYYLWRYNGGNWTPLQNGYSPSINTGTGINRLKIERVGAQIKAYANDQLLTTLSDSTYTGFRHVGLITTSYSQSNVDARFDNFVMCAPGCSGAASLSGAGVTSPGTANPMIPSSAGAVSSGASGSKTIGASKPTPQPSAAPANRDVWRDNEAEPK